ncbi:hypothetical protein ACO0QE_001596 [Hanseniaspora vineae]
MFESFVTLLLNIPKLSIFTTTIDPIIDQYLVKPGYISQYYAMHIYQIVYVAIFYELLYLVSLYMIFPITFKLRIWLSDNLLGEFASEKDNSKKSDGKPLQRIDLSQRNELITKLLKSDQQIAMHVVSLVQSLIILELCIKTIFKYQEYYFHWFNFATLFQPDKLSQLTSHAHTRIFETTSENVVICLMAAGYFLWDLFISMYCSTLPFVMHGLVSFVVYSIGLKPFINYYACIFLIFELSNPFLNIRWFSIKYQFTSLADSKKKTVLGSLLTKFFLINEIVFMLTFFNCRIVWGFVQIGLLINDFVIVRNDPRMDFLSASIIVCGNFMLDILNVYWFQTMVRIAYKKLVPSKKH